MYKILQTKILEAFFCALLCICSLGIASAIEHPTTNRDTTNSNLLLNGLSELSFNGKSLYIAGLFVELSTKDTHKIYQKEIAKRMVIRVSAATWTPSKFTTHWNNALLSNTSIQKVSRLNKVMTRFTNILQDKLVQGDQITIDYIPNSMTLISVNGVTLETINDNGFFEVLLNTWIGERPPSSAFKQGLLSFDPQFKSDENTLKKYNSLAYNENRAKIVSSWQQSLSAKPQPSHARRETQSTNNLPELADVANPNYSKQSSEGPAKQLALSAYRLSIYQAVWKKLTYPSRALKLKQQGKVLYRVKTNREGQILEIEQVISSPHKLLNKAAERAILRAKPLPPPPPDLPGAKFEVLLPFNFYL